MPSQRGHIPPVRVKVAFSVFVLLPRSTVMAPLARTEGTLKAKALGGPTCGFPSRLKRMRSIALASVTVPTVERASAPIRCWSTMIAVVSPSSTSTSGRASVGMKPCTKALYVSLMSRCDSAAIVSNTRELLPEPETPVNTVSRRFGSSTLTSLRLFTRAPWTRIRSWLSAECRAGDCVAVLVAMLICSPRGARAQGLGSPHRLLHEPADLCLFGGGQRLQRERGRPHAAFVEVRAVVEAERRVPRVELGRGGEEADDVALPGIRGHPVPGLRREGRGAGLDDRVDPLGHGPIRFRHLSDLREQFFLSRFRLELSGALLHGGSFLGRETLGLLVRRGALSGALRGPLCGHRSLLCQLSHVLLRPARARHEALLGGYSA